MSKETEKKAAAEKSVAAHKNTTAENTSAAPAPENAMNKIEVNDAQRVKADDELLEKANANATPEGQVPGDGPEQKVDTVEKAGPLVNALDPQEVAGDVKPGKGEVTADNKETVTPADKSIGANGPLVNALDAEEVAGVAKPGEGSLSKAAEMPLIESLGATEGPYTGLVDANHPERQWSDLPASKSGNKKVKFLLSPTGRFGLGYSAGDEALLNARQAEEVVEAGYAEFVNEKAKK